MKLYNKMHMTIQKMKRQLMIKRALYPTTNAVTLNTDNCKIKTLIYSKDRPMYFLDRMRAKFTFWGFPQYTCYTYMYMYVPFPYFLR